VSEPRPLRVCVTGPESTGKTSLASRLAQWAGTRWVPEASRLYAERKGTELDASDVPLIALEQAALEDAAMRRARADGAPLVVLDTDLLSTAVYSAHYYGSVPARVRAAAESRRADLYLLCDVDVPWLPDGVRDRPRHRAQMFGLFAAALHDAGIEPVIVRGDWDERWRIAVEAVTAMLERCGRAAR
jgi:HTH-type transcriptional regulator, transcriptional repressor of NAD biosynthesis genes